MFIAPQVGFEFFPFLDEGDLRIEVELPLGYNLDESSALLEEDNKKNRKIRRGRSYPGHRWIAQSVRYRNQSGTGTNKIGTGRGTTHFQQ